MNTKLWFFLGLFLYPFILIGFEGAETFNVIIYDDKVKVLAPLKFYKKLSVIIDNKTLVKQIGKVTYDDGDMFKLVSIAPNSHKTVNIVNAKQRKVFFVPLSPPFQKVELKIGQPSYEIPPKK